MLILCAIFEQNQSNMKTLLSFCLLVAAFSAARAQTAGERLELKETTYNFGAIPQSKPVYHTFLFVNKGTTPLRLDNVQASCGCTTPEWSKEPVAPGATGSIKVGYNAAAEGPFEKTVTLTYNGTSSSQLIIKGSVWRAPAGPAPTNTSLNFLKQQMQ